MHKHHVFMLILTATCATGCEKNEPAPAPQQAAAPTEAPTPAGDKPAQDSSVAHANAKAIFAQRCTMCHGMDGHGDGPAAASLNPKPRDYSDAAWQASVDDAYLAKVILEGGPAVGKSMMMPGNPDLQDKPNEIAELVKIVRSFKK